MSIKQDPETVITCGAGLLISILSNSIIYCVLYSSFSIMLARGDHYVDDGFFDGPHFKLV